MNSFLYFYRIPNLFFSPPAPNPTLNNPALTNTPKHIFFVSEDGEVYILLKLG
jgi:hypothetical protein